MGGDIADPEVRGLAVCLLGPVEIGRAGGATASVTQPRLRVLLGLLAVAAGRLVAADALTAELWPEDRSRERQKNLHSQVSALRRRLAELEPHRTTSRLARVGAGYRLVLEPGELDVEKFRSLAASGREAARARDAARARELFGDALGLWRGAPLADAVPLSRRLASEAARLEAARVRVLEERVDCDLTLGRHGEVAGELARLVAEFPLRERFAGQLMVALYRCGRRGEALATFDRTRRLLAREVGLDPGRVLVGLRQQLLADDPALCLPAQAARTPTGPTVMAAGIGSAVPGGGPIPAARAEGVWPATTALVVPRQLPAGAGYFAGREAELKQLDELLARAGTVVISALAGMAGVGKTALAVHWARRAAGRFPDGQLYVNMRGFDAAGAAVTAAEVTGWFLVALGVHADQIPADAQARAALYRSVLAGRRMLIVLDNASDAEHVRPLLPGGASCLVVVTSRSAMAGLVASNGARPLRLGPLNMADSARLLAARLGADRIAAEPEATRGLARLCGGLPLTLAVTAARAAAAPELPLHVLAGQLAGDTTTGLRELLAWSLSQLSASTGEMFALLGVHCGPDISVPAAASLAGIPRAEARRALAGLADASLAAEHRPGRYVMHDLVRAYAAEQARTIIGEPLTRAAICRSLDHYLHSMAVSCSSSWAFTPEPPAPGVAPERLDGARLRDWARAEHQVLLQAIAQAAATGLITSAWQIFLYQSEFLGAQGYWNDCQAAANVVQAAAQAAGDYSALGWSHMAIGRYAALIGRHDDAMAHHLRALNLFQQVGDLPGQAEAHSTFAYACYCKGDGLETAVTHAEQSVALFRELGDDRGAGMTLGDLAAIHAALGNYDLARDYATESLESLQTASFDEPSAAWHVLGIVHARNADHSAAIDCYRQAISLAQEDKAARDRIWGATVLADLGDACQATGDLPAARRARRQAMEILDALRVAADHPIRARLR